jgi:hypothetical protein
MHHLTACTLSLLIVEILLSYQVCNVVLIVDELLYVLTLVEEKALVLILPFSIVLLPLSTPSNIILTVSSLLTFIIRHKYPLYNNGLLERNEPP